MGPEIRKKVKDERNTLKRGIWNNIKKTARNKYKTENYIYREKEFKN